jgi:ketosteroid isomerase-like protein
MYGRTTSSKTRSSRTLGLILAILIIVAVGSYFFLIQPRLRSPEVVLTREQKEVDDFLNDYYNAYGNVSSSRLVLLFDNDSILSAPDGSVHKGVDNIRSYYSRTFMGYENFTFVRTIVKIEIHGNDAFVVYDTTVRTWHFGSTEAPLFFFKNSFELKRQGATWKITALAMEQTMPK